MPKSNYLFIRRSGTDQSVKYGEQSPAQMEAMYAKFNAWKQKFGSNVVDMGGKLASGGKIVTVEGVAQWPGLSRRTGLRLHTCGQRYWLISTGGPETPLRPGVIAARRWIWRQVLRSLRCCAVGSNLDRRISLTAPFFVNATPSLGG